MRVHLVMLTLLAVIVAPMVLQPTTLADDGTPMRSSSPEGASAITPTTGWITGGATITITGTGFHDLAFRNVTDDGLAHQWSIETADYGHQAGHENAIAVDSTGRIHILHMNGGDHGLHHSIHDGSTWTSTRIKDCEGTYCRGMHMVIDDEDVLHAAYYAQGDHLIYIRYNGSWTSTYLSGGVEFGEVGVAVDAMNHPHVSYTASGSYCGGGARLASFNGTAWNTQSVAPGSNLGCHSAIVIDDDDRVHVAYQSRSDSTLMLATNPSGTWNRYAVDATSVATKRYPGYYTSMAIDESGQFHLAHFDEWNDDLRYSTGVPNGQWTTTIVDATGKGRDPVIAIDGAGSPHIMYHTWSGFDLKHATLDASVGSWQVTTVASVGSVGDSTSFVLDDDGMIHVAFSDESANVLRYANLSTGVSVTREITVRFGSHASVTGTVINDRTIRLVTPEVDVAATVNLSLIGNDGQEHDLSSTFEFIDPDDVDGDGVLTVDDACPDTSGTSTEDVRGCPDRDGDGTSDQGDAFPDDANETADADGDGVGDNADAFPNDRNETLDSDGDGVGDNIDAFPNDRSETLDSDGDGVGDNADAFPFDGNETMDSDGDGIGDLADAFPADRNETMDSDGDGTGDNADAFPYDRNETRDSDGDGTGDNADAFPYDRNETMDSDGDGVGDASDRCGMTEDNVTVDGFGCPIEPEDSIEEPLEPEDADGDGVTDAIDACPSTEQGENVTGLGCSASQLMMLDDDGDGVNDLEDRCPFTASGTIVDENGCPRAASPTDEESLRVIDSLLSGSVEGVPATVGIGAILLALFSVLQTNAAASLLPDAFRWVQVLRKRSGLSKEEEAELRYLQSTVQAYHHTPADLAAELNQLKMDLTGRYARNEIKTDTRSKLITLIDGLLASSPDELHHIAQSDAYFGLSGSLDSSQRMHLLQEEVAMRVPSSMHQNMDTDPWGGPRKGA